VETVSTVDNNLARGCFRLLESIFLDNAEKRKIALRDDEVASVALRLQCFICLTLSCCELCAREHVQSEILYLHRRCALVLQHRAKTMGTRYRQSSDPEPQTAYADLRSLVHHEHHQKTRGWRERVHNNSVREGT